MNARAVTRCRKGSWMGYRGNLRCCHRSGMARPPGRPRIRPARRKSQGGTHGPAGSEGPACPSGTPPRRALNAERVLVILDSLPRASPSARPRGSCPGSALQRGTSTRPTAWHLLPRTRVGNTERHTHPMGKAGWVPRGDLLWRAAVQRLPGNEPLAGIIGAEMRQGRIPEARTPSGPSSYEGSK